MHPLPIARWSRAALRIAASYYVTNGFSAAFGLLRDGAASPWLFVVAAVVMGLAILTYLSGRGAAARRSAPAPDHRANGEARLNA